MRVILSNCCVIVFMITQLNAYIIEIKVKQGYIYGTRLETVFNKQLYYAFYGVPYAQPPIGNLRFKNPRSPKKWEEPYDATRAHHSTCAQAHIVHKHALHGVEDCLYMNIYTPTLPKHSDSKLKPVLVFIHGYAFASSISHIYGADFVINKDIVFISVTHRIGVFGFLKIEDNGPHVNMGLKDIIMALRWIKNNIKHFGGDKSKITVMGNDSGATFLSLLLMTKYKKWFSKIILQSGTLFSPSLFQSNYEIERERLMHNLHKMGLKDVFKASTKDIITASQKIYNSKEYVNFQKPVVPFTPTLEKESNQSLFKYTPDEFYENIMDQNMTKPILIGFSSRESISETIPFIHNSQYLKSLSSYFKYMVPFSDGCTYNYTSRSYKVIADKIKKYYFKNVISENSLDDFLQYTTDLRIYPVWKFIQAYLRSNSKMYVYKFNYVGDFNAVKATSLGGVNVKVKGASNGDELCYILPCVPLTELYAKIHNDTNNRDRIFISEITDLWTNFVKTGNPTPKSQIGRTMWQPMTSKENNLLLLGNVTKLVDTKVETKMYQFWGEIYKTMYSAKNCVKKVNTEL